MARFVKPMAHPPRMSGVCGIEISRRGFNRGMITLPFALAGCITEDARPLPERPWHHTASGFRNPPGSPVRGGDFDDWASFYARRFGDATEPDLPDGHVLPRDAVAAGLDRQRAADSLTWLGHASFLIRLDGRTIL